MSIDLGVFRRFMDEDLIPDGTKFGDYLSVALGVRPASQFISPAELPDARILGATIDERYKRKMAGRKMPGVRGKMLGGRVSKFWQRDQAKEVKFRLDAIRDIYKDVVLGSHSYRTYIQWAEDLGLRHMELESRPTIREVYLYKDPAVEKELFALQELRKDIRWQKRRRPADDQPAYARAFPEETNPVFTKKLGEILGFPPCCVARYSFDRESGVLSPEQRASDQLSNLPPDESHEPFAYFTKDFFPCLPDCENAAALGAELERKLTELDPDVGRRYRDYLAGNVDLTHRYPLLLKEHAEMLEKLSGEKEEGGPSGR